MCELMGFNFARPTTVDFTIREFGTRSQENADGWGLAWYPDESLALIKEAVKWQASEHSGFLETYAGIRSTIGIAHVRHRTRGRLTHADTHPFRRELDGKEYCFAHNGTLPTIRTRKTRRFQPVGQTDSEHFFCLLLEHIAAWTDGVASPDNWSALHDLLSDYNREGTLNFLLADGERLVAYHDRDGWKGLTLRRMAVHAPESSRLEDDEVRVEVGGEPFNYGIVVATCPLSSAGWESFQKGELVVLEGGVMRYSSHRPVATAAPLAS
jgi:glutamine amidotransferase